MPTLVSTGQITIVDNNDAKPITAFITASGTTQQIYSKDESAESYTPNWASTPLTLSAMCYVGGTTSATNITSLLSNRKWSTDLGTSLGSGTTFVINTNVLSPAAPSRVYYFEGDYTDGVTGLVSHVIAQISLTQVKTGTNAVYIQVNGQNVIEQATGQAKSFTTISCDLMRAAGVDNTGVTYKWFAAPFNTTDQIDGNYPSVLTKYGFEDTAATLAPAVTGAIGVIKTTSAGSSAAISTSNVPDGAWVDVKSLVIGELAINNIGLYQVQAKDSDGTIYQANFTIYDVSDVYDCKLTSSSGDKLQNGVGSTTITPQVYYGAAQVTPLTGWSFNWYFYDRDGKRAAFVDTAKISTAGGAPITTHTTGASAVFNYTGASFAFAAGHIVKAVKPDGSAFYYEVASSTTNQVTIRTPSTNTFLNFTNFPAPSATTDFAGGRLYGCTTSGMRTTDGTTPAITVTGDEIDVKGNIVVEANRP